jgi:suppressor of ftsI
LTNLHFHGLHVSPDAPQYDVITMMAMPGQVLHYTVNIPLDQAPELYWYHTHPHGESYQQDVDGMSGAIVINGMERYVPEVQHLRERILVLRDRVLEDDDSASAELRHSIEIPANGCWASTDPPKRILTINGALRPRIAIAPGERQFWRIVNASPDLYADLQVDTEQLEIVALDGMPLSFHDPKRRVELRDHLLVPPAGRVEAIVTGPTSGAHAALRTRCYDTGLDGDPIPAMVLADMVATKQPRHRNQAVSNGLPTLLYKPVPAKLIASTETGIVSLLCLGPLPC